MAIHIDEPGRESETDTQVRAKVVRMREECTCPGARSDAVESTDDELEVACQQQKLTSRHLVLLLQAYYVSLFKKYLKILDRLLEYSFLVSLK